MLARSAGRDTLQITSKRRPKSSLAPALLSLVNSGLGSKSAVAYAKILPLARANQASNHGGEGRLAI